MSKSELEQCACDNEGMCEFHIMEEDALETLGITKQQLNYARIINKDLVLRIHACAAHCKDAATSPRLRAFGDIVLQDLPMFDETKP